MKSNSIILILILFFIGEAHAQVSLPYNSDFELEEGFTTGVPLENNWYTTSDSIVITDEKFYSGAQSIRIPFNTPENILSLDFNLPEEPVLFVDYYINLFLSTPSELPSLIAPETTFLLTVQPYGSGQGRWAFLDGDGNGGGTWFSANETLLLDQFDQTGWHHITLRFNLISDSWDLYIDGKLLAVDLGFAKALLPESTAINIYGTNSAIAYLDAFSLMTSNPLFQDADSDGMSDDYETLYKLNSSVNDRDLDPDMDGLTNIEEYMYDTDPFVSNIVSVELPANSNLTRINEVNGNLEIINDNTLLFSGPLNKIFGLKIIGAENSGDISILSSRNFNGFLSIEGDLGTIIFNSALTVATDLKVSGAKTVLFNEPVTVKGATTIDVSNSIYVNASLDCNKDVRLTTATDLILSNGSIAVTDGNLSVTSAGNLVIDAYSNLTITSGSLNASVSEDLIISNNSKILVAAGSAFVDAEGAIWLDNGSSFTVDNALAAFGNMQLNSDKTITVSKNSLIDASNNYMILIAQDYINLVDNSALNAASGYVIIQTLKDLTVMDSTMSLNNITLFLQVGHSLDAVRSAIHLETGIAQLIVFTDATVEENSSLILNNSDLYAQINSNLTVSNNSKIAVSKGGISLNVIGNALVERNSLLEVNNSTMAEKSLQLIVSGSTTFDSNSLLAVENTALNIFSFDNINLFNSDLTVLTGNASIRTNANLTLTDSTPLITHGNLSTNVAQSTYISDSNITVTSGSFYLNTRADLIMDTSSALDVTDGDLYANIFGKATLEGAIHLESLFAMYVQGDFTLARTGSLDALTAYLSSGQNIAIDGRMNTNKINGQIYLYAQNLISMESVNPITSQLLSVISSAGIFLRTDVELLTVQAVGRSLKNTFALGNYTGSAEIEIHEVDNVIINTAYNADGPIRLIAGGTITATQVISATDAPGHNVGLMSTRGDIEVDLVNVGTTYGQISLSAYGEIRELSKPDEDTDIIGNMAVIYAGTSIGDGDAALEISTTELHEFASTDVIFDTIGDVEVFLSTDNNKIHVRSLQGNVIATHVDNRNNKIDLESPNGGMYIGFSDSSVVESNNVFITISENSVRNEFEMVLSATDFDSDNLNWSIKTNGSNGVASVKKADVGNTATINYLPNSNFNGNDNFVVQVTGTNGSIKNITVDVTVNKHYPKVDYSDTDSDGILDEIENLYDALNPNLATDILEDYDNDGIPNIFEIYNDSNPDDPESTPNFEERPTAYFKVDASQNETNAFATIAEAVAAAQDYNYTIIEVLPGDYVENVFLSSPTLLIASQGSEQIVLRSTNPDEEALTIRGLCVLDGFNIRYDQGPAIELDSTEQTVIKNCSISAEGVNLQFTHGGGISKSGGIVDIINCQMPEATE